MTTKFSKTYTRKGGEANSKFEEVFGNRKATLSTKWGETTYKAQLGSRRPAHTLATPDTSALHKKLRLERDDEADDPFGFDSDEEQSETSRGSEEEQSGQNTGGGVNTAAPVHSPSPVVSGSKHASHAANLKPAHKDSSSFVERLSECSPSESSEGESAQTGSASENSRSAEQEAGGPETAEKPIDFEPLPLIKPARDRVYRRAGKKGEQENSQNSPLSGENSSNKPTVKIVSTSVSTSTGSEVKGRGRVRDYTLLHPSCVSVCNVTIQDSMERGVEESVSTTPSDLGDTGTFRRKTDNQPPKYSRHRPTKSKLECKLEFFGFEDGVCEDGDAEPGTSYKIKYFGFDDLSESDSEDEDDRPGKKKEKKRDASETATAASHCPPTGEALHLSHTLTDPEEWQDELSSGGADTQRERAEKHTDKLISRKIFKKTPTKAVYNARHWNQPEQEEAPPTSQSDITPKPTPSSANKDADPLKDDGVFKAPPPPPKVPKSVTPPTEPHPHTTTSEQKELYTVVQQVKHFNDVVEFGENQEFTDDFEYLETGLKSTQPLHTRCLSIISLATRCAMPSFRMHLRARGKVAQVFNMLSDAPQHPSLALCTAALLYILSRDRLNMDLDRACLELMIRLLEMEQDESEDHQSKVKEKIQKLCETVHNKHLDLDNITTGHLAMETLLSLTSKRAGDWFKEELRLLGGLDHIIDKVKECVENLETDDDNENLVASLWGAERCLRVLESVTVHNPENQSYLIAYKDSQLIASSARALRHCESMIQLYCRNVINSGANSAHSNHSNVGKAVQDCLRALLGVMLNLTHDNEWGSTKTGEQDQLIMTVLNCVLKVPQFLPQEQKFDIRVLGLGLLINLVEYSSRNRHCLVELEVDSSCLLETEKDGKAEGEKDKGVEDDKKGLEPKTSSALPALVQLFLERERAAVLAEAQADNIISEAPKPQPDVSGQWQVTSGEMQWVASENNTDDKKEKEEEEEELDFNKVLQHAGKHMEDSIVASYTALLLGCVCQDSPVNVKAVRESLPKGDFSIMTEMLKKFLNFMNLTCAVGTTGQKSITRVLDYLEHC
ncbi:wings apart-like protein homolog isoform X1 [Tachysurus fulvidraco]|uniref:wings apart-like protein homolog isoform X1 n=1 Tax=Tachysurus fulvidraco TaxID=1234273 RepID=UPI001FEDDA97|nr:wings apart-like protein homolog isoform X1 [Tachysurus fulvidraco]